MIFLSGMVMPFGRHRIFGRATGLVGREMDMRRRLGDVTMSGVTDEAVNDEERR